MLGIIDFAGWREAVNYEMHAMRHLIISAALAGLVFADSCTVVEGPCKVVNNEIVCMEGGKATIFTPRPLAETVYAINPVPQTISVDPRILVPPKERN